MEQFKEKYIALCFFTFSLFFPLFFCFHKVILILFSHDVSDTVSSFWKTKQNDFGSSILLRTNFFCLYVRQCDWAETHKVGNVVFILFSMGNSSDFIEHFILLCVLFWVRGQTFLFNWFIIISFYNYLFLYFKHSSNAAKSF